jgi:hypothetical protein
MNLKEKFQTVTLILGLLYFVDSGFAQTVRLDNGKSDSTKETVVASLRCQGFDIQFAKGVRWTPSDFSATISVSGPAGKSTTMNPSCQREMSCILFDEQPAVVILDAPACGGNAVPDEYTVIQIRSMQKKTFSYAQAKNLGLINASNGSEANISCKDLRMQIAKLEDEINDEVSGRNGQSGLGKRASDLKSKREKAIARYKSSC